ncbi:MAG: class I SAM-dependent methyltransferase [Ferruginibacter sp.]
MNVSGHNEQLAATAFDLQSKIFDELYLPNSIIQYKRERVRAHVQQYIGNYSSVLELNSGTGEDAIWFAAQGHQVHATDISEGMQQILKQKIAASGLNEKISTETISYTALKDLRRATCGQQKKEYDLVFSNFAGLNCTGELDNVLHSLAPLLKAGGIATLVILPKFCLWEFLLLFKGKFKTAFRRLFSRNGVTAHIEGTFFTCWYYNPSYVIKHLKNDFDLLDLEGLCTLVPPSYMERFAEKHPKTFSYLRVKENKWKRKWPWKYIGDYYIITLQKK